MIAGIHKAVIISHRWHQAYSGTRALAVTVELEGELGTDSEITGYIWFSSKGMNMARAQLKAIGFDPDTQELKEIGKTISLIGNECCVELKEEEYQGNISLRVRAFRKEIKEPDASEFDMLQKGLKSCKKQEPPAEEDIPF